MIARQYSITWRRRAPPLALSALIALAGATASAARELPANCALADHAYRLVQRDALKADAEYAACLSEAFGRDDCAASFVAVTATQMRFAAAVADVRIRCGQ